MNALDPEKIGRWMSDAGAEYFELHSEERNERILRYANNAVFQATCREVTSHNLRAWIDGTMSEVRTRSSDPERVRAAVKRCVDRARATAKLNLPKAPPPTGAHRDKALLNYCDAGIESLIADPRAAEMGFKQAFKNASSLGVELAGRTSYGQKKVCVSNSLGMYREYAVTESEARVISVDQHDDHISGHSAAVGRMHDSVNIPQLAEVAIEKAVRARKRTEVPAGNYDVILEPSAVAEILMWMGSIAFTSKAIKDRSSFLRDRMGEQVTSEILTISDDARGQLELGVPQPFDTEGTSKEKVVILDHGIASGVVWDRQSALEAGCHSTGHASDGGLEFSSGPSTNHLCIEVGEHSTQQLLDRVEKGLWVTRFHYVNGLLDPPRAVMTGLTRDGTFLIHEGQLGPDVGMLRFTDSLVEAFQRIDGISNIREAVRMNFSNDGTYLCPTILIRNLKFTGTAKG